MSIPVSLSELSKTAASNPPDGSVETVRTMDDYLRTIFALMRAGFTSAGSIAVASSVAVPSDGLLLRLTGGGTVTVLTGGFADRTVLLQCDAATSFTHATALQCPGGVDMSVGAGDFVLAERRSSVWYLYSVGGQLRADLDQEISDRQSAIIQEADARANADSTLQNNINALARSTYSASGGGNVVPGNQVNTLIPLTSVSGGDQMSLSDQGMLVNVTGEYEIRAQIIQGVDVANQGDQGYYSVMIVVNGAIVAEDIIPLHNNCGTTITPFCHRISLGLYAGQTVKIYARARYQGGGSTSCYVQARRH